MLATSLRNRFEVSNLRVSPGESCDCTGFLLVEENHLLASLLHPILAVLRIIIDFGRWRNKSLLVALEGEQHGAG